MDTQPTPPQRASPQQQCYVTALALMARVGGGALAHAEPADVQAFLRMLQDAHRFLDAGLLDPDGRPPAPAPAAYDGPTDPGGEHVSSDV